MKAICPSHSCANTIPESSESRCVFAHTRSKLLWVTFTQSGRGNSGFTCELACFQRETLNGYGGCTIASIRPGMQASAEFLDCKALEPGCLLDVETKSRHYRIECLGGSTVRISGHPQYCPTPVKAELQGSLNREGELDTGLIERGHRLVFVMENHVPITTSKVLHVRVEAKPQAS